MDDEQKAQMKRDKQRIYNKRHYEKNKADRQERNRAYYAKLKACCEGSMRPPLTPIPTTRPPISPPINPPLVDYSSDDEDDNVTNLVIKYLTNRKLANGDPVAKNTVRIDLNNVKLLRANCGQSLEDCMKNIDQVEDMAKNWGISKRQTFFRTFNIIGDWMFKHGLISKTTKDAYAKLNRVVSLENRDNQEANKSKEYPSFGEYMMKLKAEYAPDSNVYLLAKLYEENSGVRDGYSNANVYDKLKPEVDDENYFVIKSRGPCQFVLNKHKTSNKERFVFSYSAPVSKLLRAYMKANNINYGQSLFANVSSLFSKVNKSLGYNIGGTNAFRHMIITDLLSRENLTATQRVAIADRFFHSPEMSSKYVRQLINEVN